MNTFIIIVLDGVGIGELPDADQYSDQGSNTLLNISKQLNGITLPNLQKFGLGNISGDIVGLPPATNPLASYGKMAEASFGKDSISGHWEIGGLKVEIDFPYYPEGFPESIVSKFLSLTCLKGVLGNKAASGTEIIKELGDEHIRTGFPIIYTSADSVFQIAAHEKYFGLQKLYDICETARFEIFNGSDSIGRIIARPFTGESGNYERTTNRKDYAIDPPEDTILDYAQKNGIETVAIGKINDLFNHRGINKKIKTKSNLEGIEEILKAEKEYQNSLIFVNLVDFDVYYGHRNDPEGFHKALQEFDSNLPKIIDRMDDSDHLILTADHGNDPTSVSTDHSREYVPLIYFNKRRNGINLGIRETFADVAQTAAHFFKINNSLRGKSFLNEK
ncbi:MAG: phosphopentomutase [Bacteroidetes bacterium]|nr:phosphopentomutase [Bacteroidota bacterium]MBU1677437.1 phosphopentomutase [Bacteroidota bacterium]MBU2506166.1 phosphopentomutase [Bacteroidota bacterium]